MKPRIRMDRGVWVCSQRVGGFSVPPLGHGYTAKEAYAEWERMARIAGRLA